MSTQELKKEIIYNLIYGEIFEHPLCKEELIKYSSCQIEDPSNLFDLTLQELVEDGMIKNEDGFYYVFDDKNKVKRRKEGSQKAEALMPKALRTAEFINKFPYVEGVGISGSMSKGVLHEDGDIDFFVITTPNRLWVARTLLILYKKIFLRNSRKYFCVNYFIDTNNLEIQEKNKFTAMEITTLIPASGVSLKDFFKENDWVKSFHANYDHVPSQLRKKRKPWWSRGWSKILNGKLGEWADERCMRMTLRRWKRKFGSFDHDKFDLTMKSRKYVSKHHPQDFQNKVLNKYELLVTEFKTQHSCQLSKSELEL